MRQEDALRMSKVTAQLCSLFVNHEMVGCLYANMGEGRVESVGAKRWGTF